MSIERIKKWMNHPANNSLNHLAGKVAKNKFSIFVNVPTPTTGTNSPL
jgi:hypothetical protein